ncbi:MAG: SNF2-related protein, partial [Polyangiales bacterium]
MRRRGEVYALNRAVTLVRSDATRATAIVEGSDAYRVELTLAPVFEATCTCPYFLDRFEPCKHAWATLLVLERGAHPSNEVLTYAAPVPAVPTPPMVQRSRKPTWREVLDVVRSHPATAREARREVRYGLEVANTRANGALTVTVFDRVCQGNYAWRPRRVGHDPASEVGGADAEILHALDATAERSAWSREPAIARYPLPAWIWPSLVPRMCASGNLRLIDSPDDLGSAPVAWDDGPPYTVALVATEAESGGALDLSVWLDRPGERVPVREPRLCIAGGLVFFADRVARLDDFGQFAWIATSRLQGDVRVAARDIDAFLDELYATPRAPALTLPPSLALAEVRAVPRPFVVMKTPGRNDYDRQLHVAAGFDYDGARVPVDSRGEVAIDRARRRKIVRDAAAEGSARALLAANGIRPASWGGQTPDHPYRLAPSRLLSAVRALVDAGWRVEVDGRVQRRAESFALGVSTGVDWFEVNVDAKFDGVALTMPELLSALRHKRNTVVLADGSHGVVPDEWMARLRRWAGFGARDDGSLRFDKSQVALVAALAEQEAAFACDAAFEKLRDELAAFDGTKARAAPKGFRGTLRDYQRVALGWFEFWRRFGFGGCLADDMGLGKTVQVLALLESRRTARPAVGPSLVVVPRTLLDNWQREAGRFAPRLRVFVHDGVDRVPPGEHFGDHDVVLTTYGILRRDLEPLAKVRFDYAVLDEAHTIKNAKSIAAKAACAIDARHRLALSGTPVENHLGELASLFAFLNPGMLGGARAFDAVASGARTADAPTRAIVAQAIRPFFLRRTKREVARELPDRVEQTIVCDLGVEQRRLYDQLRAHYRASLGKRIARDGMAKSTVHVLEALLRLRQAACHAGLVDSARRADPGAKIDVLLDHLENVCAEKQKALVFSQFTSLLSIVRDRLDERGWRYEYLDGKTRDRAERVDRFQKDASCPIFLLSLKAGGLGLNLTAAEY